MADEKVCLKSLKLNHITLCASKNAKLSPRFHEKLEKHFNPEKITSETHLIY